MELNVVMQTVPLLLELIQLLLMLNQIHVRQVNTDAHMEISVVFQQRQPVDAQLLQLNV